MNKLEYGIVKEYDNYDLWYEPITNEIDGFVLRTKEDGYILSVFSKDKNSQCNQDETNYIWDGSGD